MIRINKIVSDKSMCVFLLGAQYFCEWLASSIIIVIAQCDAFIHVPRLKYSRGRALVVHLRLCFLGRMFHNGFCTAYKFIHKNHKR